MDQQSLICLTSNCVAGMVGAGCIEAIRFKRKLEMFNQVNKENQKINPLYGAVSIFMVIIAGFIASFLSYDISETRSALLNSFVVGVGIEDIILKMGKKVTSKSP